MIMTSVSTVMCLSCTVIVLSSAATARDISASGIHHQGSRHLLQQLVGNASPVPPVAPPVQGNGPPCGSDTSGGCSNGQLCDPFLNICVAPPPGVPLGGSCGKFAAGLSGRCADGLFCDKSGSPPIVDAAGICAQLPLAEGASCTLSAKPAPVCGGGLTCENSQNPNATNGTCVKTKPIIKGPPAPVPDSCSRGFKACLTGQVCDVFLDTCVVPPPGLPLGGRCGKFAAGLSGRCADGLFCDKSGSPPIVDATGICARIPVPEGGSCGGVTAKPAPVCEKGLTCDFTPGAMTGICVKTKPVIKDNCNGVQGNSVLGVRRRPCPQTTSAVDKQTLP